MLRRIFLFLLLVLVILAFLQWGLPFLVANAPQWCERAKLTTGICDSRRFEQVKGVQSWVERSIHPYTQQISSSEALANAYRGLTIVEDAARQQLGEERVEEGLHRMRSALDMVGASPVHSDTQQKIQDIPGNAQRLLADARRAVEQLRDTLTRTSRRAEEVTDAVNDTREALDALSKVLPEESPR